MTYSVDYFLEKFDAIPDENWLTRKFIDEDEPEKRCALGHCDSSIMSHTDEGEKLISILGPGSALMINDGITRYAELGDTPKERILNALLLVKCGLWKESLGG